MRCWGAILCCAAVVFATAVSAQQLRGAARVVDGDTLAIDGARVRLFGIDAPERGQPCRDGGDCGAQSQDFLEALIGGRQVTCAPEDIDRYGRVVATCFAGGADLNRAMVRAGHALPYIEFSRRYEADAPANPRFAAPWSYRRTATGPPRQVSPRAQSAVQNLAETRERDCAIKGNISSGGVRIYHTPGGRSYAATRIDEGRGERWFCTTAEAEAAGWRAVRR
ncbi:MAG: thermonuclease family protein [Proteobacteria bacterium]|nr:thermonuclease family protein [Pseudomonadota bacterium]